VGLLVVSNSVILIAAASQITATLIEQDLSSYWRTTYDILVRPSGAHSPIEEAHGLVEANHLSGIPGGITFEQYEAIKSIPDVEVAAPIAMIGYVPQFIFTDDIELPDTSGAYLLEETFTTDDGDRLYSGTDFTRRHFFYVGSDATVQLRTSQSPIINHPTSVRGSLDFPFLVAGIVPSQEAALIGLDQALIKGEYLADNAPINLLPLMAFDSGPDKETTAPVLINSTIYVSMTVNTQLKRLVLPLETSNFEKIMAQGGNKYLATLPGETIDTQEMNTNEAYQRLLAQLQQTTSTDNFAIPFAWDIPSHIIYQEIQPPFTYEGLVLEIVMPGSAGTMGWPNYRTFTGPSSEQADFQTAFALRAHGVFDIEHIPQPADVNRVPLETYFPPMVVLHYDEEGQPVEPRPLRPTANPAGYIQSPPLVLTTLEAARAIRGEDAISAIRVRVGGIEELTPAAQRKIETIAGEIARQTGLDVDIMVGSSPTRVLVHVPGVGYVEEQWIQKNVTYTYQERVQTGHLLLLGTLLSIGGLFVLDLAWAEVVARRHTIALQKALGWRSATVFRQVLSQILLVGVVATLLGALVAVGISRLAGWPMPSLSLLLGVPLLVVGLCLVGGAYPAWLAARVPPIVGLQQGGIHSFHERRSQRPTYSLWPFAWRGLARRWSRSALGGLTATLSAALLVLMLAVTVDRQGAMSGTLLGEFILVQIEGYHYAIVAIGFGLAVLSLANSLLAGVLERRREIGVLKAVGWRTGTVGQLFVMEGILLGALGGLVGAVLGLVTFIALYESVSTSLIGIGLVGIVMPVLVGAVAALYPARVAARVPPAEAVRYE
jgi:hypothetical protein